MIIAISSIWDGFVFIVLLSREIRMNMFMRGHPLLLSLLCHPFRSLFVLTDI